jgi:hypothetical protein
LFNRLAIRFRCRTQRHELPKFTDSARQELRGQQELPERPEPPWELLELLGRSELPERPVQLWEHPAPPTARLARQPEEQRQES